MTKDAATAHDDWRKEQEAIAAAEAATEYEYEYVYEETGDGEYEYEDYEECLVCEEGEYDEDPAPRFFFSQISQIFDNTRNLPCCKDNRQTETTTEPTGPR